ncbi:MFS transporter [Novosphingobium sp. P6W]|uniref:MFS transporter n=1 Tax=Novosphingobium sp. P6W TaxID=1609758 RepID=UPI0005C2DC9B|nr:MFS transporter [Novosphingobium sp. P6W]KIS31350.1 hypothetical protein TQ38_17890 [Novosphingobium sp. P6W]
MVAPSSQTSAAKAVSKERTESTAFEAVGGWDRRKMVICASLSQNVVIGSAFGGFGVSLIAMQERFGAGRGIAALGLALAVLTMSLATPLVATLIHRIGLRATMMAGIAMSGLGYVMLALAPNLIVVLVTFFGLIGPGIALAGSLPASLLAGGWYPHARGRAVGIATMPLMVAAVPIIGLALISDYGLTAFYAALASLHLVSLPILLAVRDAPAAGPADGNAAVRVDEPAGAVPILGRGLFWALVLGAGTLNAIGITGVSQIVAVLVERGISAERAAGLVALMGMASIVGAPLGGWLADRLGGPRTLALIACGFSAAWAVIAFVVLPLALTPALVVIGLCGAGVFPAVNLACIDAFGLPRLGKALGLFGVFALPLTFLLPPGAGLLRDQSQNYLPVMAAIVVCCGLIAVMFLSLYARERLVERFVR